MITEIFYPPGLQSTQHTGDGYQLSAEKLALTIAMRYFKIKLSEPINNSAFGFGDKLAVLEGNVNAKSIPGTGRIQGKSRFLCG